MALPTRTSADANSAADINSLQAQITSLTATVASATAAIYGTLANYGQNVSVDGVSKTLYFKTITGTTDADTETAVLHGVTGSKIIYVISDVGNTDGRKYSTNLGTLMYTGHDNTYAYITNSDAAWQSQPYKMTIAYHS